MGNQLKTLPQSPVIVGHSLGGMVGLHLALQARTNLRALVLVDAFPALSLNESILPGMFGPTTSEAVRLRVETMMTSGRTQMDVQVRAKLWRSIETMNVTERLSGLRIPVLGIYGGRGRYQAGQAVELKNALRLDRIPSCEVVVIPGAGHFVQWEAAEAFNHSLDRFLKCLMTHPRKSEESPPPHQDKTRKAD